MYQPIHVLSCFKLLALDKGRIRLVQSGGVLCIMHTVYSENSLP